MFILLVTLSIVWGVILMKQHYKVDWMTVLVVFSFIMIAVAFVNFRAAQELRQEIEVQRLDFVVQLVEQQEVIDVFEGYSEAVVFSRFCSITSECANGGQPIAVGDTFIVRNSCINGRCVRSVAERVECTNNQVCVDRFDFGFVCDYHSGAYDCVKTDVRGGFE